MLRMKRIGTLSFALFVAHAGASLAAPAYSIANAPAKVHPGDVFTVDLLLDLDGNASTGHEVSVQFAPGLLVAEDAVEAGVPPYQLKLSPGVRAIDNEAGVVEQFEAAAFESIAPSAPFLVGRITFRAGQVGRAEINAFFGSGAALLGADGQPIAGVVFNGAKVRVVPASKAKSRKPAKKASESGSGD